ncbi:MAG: hypothetical protein ACJA0G_001107 [Kangiellaceae bacterium]|jgi:hypothetical protein
MLGVFIIMLMACAQQNSEKPNYSKTHSYGSTYALQFISKTHDVTVAFDLQRKEITIKSLENEHLIKFSEVKSITFKATENKGMFIIKTLGNSNEIGMINRVDFNVFAEEMKSSIPSLKLAIL